MRKDGFYELLHGRGLNTTKLAKAIGSSRGHVTEVLNGKPGHGAQTRKKLARMLTWEELQKLGWTPSGQKAGGGQGRTILDLESPGRGTGVST